MEEYELQEIAIQNENLARLENSNRNNNNNNNDGGSPIISSDKATEQFNIVASSFELESEKLRIEDNKKDVEANGQPLENEEDFKLRKYFENSKRMELEHGGKPKRMGVSVKNLTVVGTGSDVSVISDMTTPFKWMGSFFNPYSWSSKASHGTTFNILKDVNTFVKDGEMLLVLGRPGAGCSTLLRIISNQTKSYVEVKGEVKYGGIASKEWERFRGEAIYTPEEDIHYPTLTLKETLDFALKTKTPGNRLNDETKKSFRDRIFDLLVSMYGIVHQKNTIVGNEYVRGLSGGERKRTTIAEAMVSSASITCWDCSTRGLDAASALDYAKSLRIMSDTLDKTTIASFYQAGESIYDLFDKVIVLEKGRCIFFGPVKEAKQYFLDLGFDCEPRKSTADFLTGVTNPQERIIKAGFESTVPQTSEDFENAWKSSKFFHQRIEEQSDYDRTVEQEKPSIDFIEQVVNQKSKTARKKSPYMSSFITQVKALTTRHFQIIWGDKFSICSRYFSVLVQSLIYGSVFYQIPTSTGGVFTRGGAIFSCILFNAFLSQAELPMTFVGRRILQKHKSYAMYRPSALHIAQVTTDLPIIFLQVFLFSIVAYFMFGLDYDAGKFFIFCFTLIGAALCATNLFRVIGNFCGSLYIAQNVLIILLIFMITYAGYTIPYDKMHPWFQWFFWINPFAYAFKALMANEFKGLEFTCEDGGAIPAPTSLYPDSQYRVCGIRGAEAGILSITGETYLDTSLGFKTSDRTLNVIVVYLFWLLFTGMNMFALEFFDWTSGGYTHKVYKPGKAPKMNDVEEEKRQAEIVLQATDASNMKQLHMRGGMFTWQHIKYTVPVPGGKRQLLDDIEGWIKPGQMTALMGSSGAGKTTLLDVLAKRKTLGTIEGVSKLNGKPLEIDFERITGYVEQMDVHNPYLTVREHLRFNAKLRQDPEISIEEKFDYVEKVLEMMEMKHLGDALIGDLESGVGISVEERKRLTIGVELVAKPHILFLDEPTSGLDAQSSYNIIKFIRKLADAGMPLVCTIHQPSSVLFEYFDRLLLLAKGGKTVYFGDIGEKSRTLTSYFQKFGVRACTESENPAEYILEAIGAGVHGKTDIDWPAAWKNSPEFQSVKDELDAIEHTQPETTEHSKEKPREFASSHRYQFIEVYKRMNLIWWRDPYYNFARFAKGVLLGLIIGFSFWNLKDSSTDMQQRIFVVFQSLLLGIMLIFSALPHFFVQREYFRRDYASKLYSWPSFAFSIVFVEIPYLVITGTLFFFCCFWTAGLDSDGTSGFYYWAFFMMYLFFCVSFGQALAAVCINIFFAMIIVPLIIIFLFLFSGVLVPPNDLPYFWRSWMYHLNPARYFLEGLVTSVLKSTKVVCDEEDLSYFNIPQGETCYSYASVFIENSPGYIQNPNATDSCGYCVFKDGESYYSTLGWSADNRGRNYGILSCFFVFNILLVFLFVFLTKKGSR